MSPSHVAAVIFISAGTVFLIISAFGVVIFPDFYSRLHASGIGETLGAMLMTIGMMFMTGLTLMSLKILIVFLILLIANPLGTNMIMLAAVRKKDFLDYNEQEPADQYPTDAVSGNGGNVESDEDENDNDDKEDDEENDGREEPCIR